MKIEAISNFTIAFFASRLFNVYADEQRNKMLIQVKSINYLLQLTIQIFYSSIYLSELLALKHRPEMREEVFVDNNFVIRLRFIARCRSRVITNGETTCVAVLELN